VLPLLTLPLVEYGAGWHNAQARAPGQSGAGYRSIDQARPSPWATGSATREIPPLVGFALRFVFGFAARFALRFAKGSFWVPGGRAFPLLQRGQIAL